MTAPDKPAIDLSSLPPSVRQQVEAGLAKLPPEMRRQLLEKGSPLLDKAIARAKAQATTTTNSTRAINAMAQGHYSRTVAPGDRVGLHGWLFFLAALLALAIWWWR